MKPTKIISISFSLMLISSVLLILVSLTIVPGIVQSQVEKRIVFTKARKTFTLQGKLPRQTADYDAYVFRARKGQTITVKLATTDRDASFSIFETKLLGPEEDMIFPPNDMNRRYTGELPITSEYAVQVYGKAFASDGPGTGAAYTIEISLR